MESFHASLTPSAPENYWRREALKAFLAWHVDAGVDAAISETPRRFLEEQQPTNKSALPEPLLKKSTADDASTSPAHDSSAAAEEAAQTAQSLSELKARLSAFSGLRLKETANQLVFADGDPKSPVMFIGEAPGHEEDQMGLPFVGPSGKLLNKMLAAIGLDRSSVYVTNVIPWRPPRNRTPTPQEMALLLPFNARHISLVAPAFIVCLGGAATQALLDKTEGVLRMRGRWFTYPSQNRMIPLLPMFHPAYLLRQPAQKRLAWRDLRTLAKAMAERNLMQQT